MTKLTNQEYVDHDGDRCPKCSSPQISREPFDPRTYTKSHDCNSCGATWDEYYILGGFMNLELQEA